MKFAKELEEDLVPEWRAKYLNYKQGKKKIKAVARALRNAQRSPRTPLRTRTTPKTSTPDDGVQTDRLTNGNGSTEPPAKNSDTQQDGEPPGSLSALTSLSKYSWKGQGGPSAIPIPKREQREQLRDLPDEDNSLRQDGDGWTRYGSIIGTPPSPSISRPATLNLPEPAMENSYDGEFQADSARQSLTRRGTQNSRPSMQSNRTHSLSAFEVGKTRHPSLLRTGMHSRNMSAPYPPGKHGLRDRLLERPLLQRLFSPRAGSGLVGNNSPDIPLEAHREIEAKEADFEQFLREELRKIEDFYKDREEESTKRLEIIREQLHLMRDQRMAEIMEYQRAKEARKANKQDPQERGEDGHTEHSNGHGPRKLPHGMDLMYHPIKAAKKVTFHSSPKANIWMTPPDRPSEQRRDYERRRPSQEIPYLNAKRKLKVALQEFYKGLELLKSYALLNRTGFRKINKKYDKTVGARPTMRFMNEHVNNAWFVTSTILDGHITAVEDLYARYFENGSHKVAVGKLRQKTQKAGASAGSSFRNGLTFAAGLVFGIESLVSAGRLLFSNDPSLSEKTSYLLQLYGGYFCLLFLVLFFCIDCRLFTKAKVNYVFVFEFDTRHHLDWRQLAEIPCFFLFLQGFIMYLNFHRVGGDVMYIYWPVILVALSFIILFLPAPILYHKSRRWFLYSCWRLIPAGLYPVEFRDFFLGDMFCSQTYALGNVELFFCLYAHDFNNPQQCNSSNSRLMGFFTTLPGIWRALQCIRRYYDTRNIFPHLVNCGKYTFTILYYLTLSLYRLNLTDEMKALFIVMATVNAIYCSVWDLVMDWSLCGLDTRYTFLRDEIAYKRPSIYYCAMVLDPILRFNWVLYAAIPPYSQHSSLVSFFVAFSEICRRGVWTIFRVENEHCHNVQHYRASRETPLPYKFPEDDVDYESTQDETGNATQDEEMPHGGGGTKTDPKTERRTQAAGTPATLARSQTSGMEIERASTRESAMSSLRRRQTGPTRPSPSIRTRVGNILHSAHAQDFERKKKKPEDEAPSEDDDEDDDERRRNNGQSGGNGSDDDDDDDDDQENEADADEARRDQSDIRDAQTFLHRARSGESM